ncbi:transmembrane ascorbate-dependent reductase CYB561-like [Amphiura filiformis]|uniref:transmembrane ascorbate-dependent reductase CYB561-like n=1 Tax=Amphiura filiformis TaxID=82378 RepID=UPI003B222768
MAWWDIDPFWPLLIISQLSGFGVVGIMTYWIMEYKKGQFSWGKHDGGTISYHAFMFTLGMVFLFGEAMLLFPVPKRLHLRSHFWRKVMHGCTQSMAIIFSIVGLKAIFLAKKEGGHHEFYSIHSWVGMASAMLFFLQQGVAIFFYVFSKFFGLSKFFGPRFMIRFTSMHTFFGYVLFAMAIASCLTGMDRWIAIFVPDYSLRPTPTLLGDIYALMMMLYGVVVTYLTTRPPTLKKKKSTHHKKLANGDRGEEEKGLQPEKEDKQLNDNDHELTPMKKGDAENNI